MKTSNRFAAIALTAGALVMTCAGAANAQLPENMKFTTTFPFMVGSTTLPAGAYTVRPLPQDNALLEISNGRNTVLVLTENDSPKAQPRQDEVIFVKHDDNYVLKNIWDSATRSGVEPVPTRAERQMMHDKSAR